MQLKEEMREEVIQSMIEVKEEVRDEVNAYHTEVSAITIAVDSLAGRLRRLEAEKACIDPAAVGQTCLDDHLATATTEVTQRPLTSGPVPVPNHAALGASETAIPSCPSAPSACSTPVSFPGHQTNMVRRKPQDFDGSVPLEAYLAQFEMLAVVQRWDELEKAVHLVSCLRALPMKYSGISPLHSALPTPVSLKPWKEDSATIIKPRCFVPGSGLGSGHMENHCSSCPMIWSPWHARLILEPQKP